jgi:UDP-glucose 4-epimerase
LANRSFALDLLARLWPLSHVANRLARRRLIGRLIAPLLNQRCIGATIVPIQETVGSSESVALPQLLLEPLLSQASYRVAMSRCICRTGEGCQSYPRDLGCIFLGEGAREIAPQQGRAVSVDEALAHVRRAVGLGLVPLIVHSAFDALVLGIRKHERMLAVCFCCDCCCVVRGTLRDGPPQFWERITRLPDLQVTVSDSCTACGACLSLCYVQAISIENGRAQIGEDCKGCGRCAAICPNQAIEIHVPGDGQITERLQARIRTWTDIGPGH